MNTRTKSKGRDLQKRAGNTNTTTPTSATNSMRRLSPHASLDCQTTPLLLLSYLLILIFYPINAAAFATVSSFVSINRHPSSLPTAVKNNRERSHNSDLIIEPIAGHLSNIQLEDRSLQMSSSPSSGDRDNTEEGTMMRFGKFQISPTSIFYRASLSYATVNLRPIVPGHVLIIPNRIVPRLSQLNTEEYSDLWNTVRKVQNTLEEYYNAGGFNVAVQDGAVAGQSVPHVHVHILPRVNGDFERNDDVYDELESWTPKDSSDDKKVKTELKVLDDEDRKDRTGKEMSDEAALYRELIAKNNVDE